MDKSFVKAFRVEREPTGMCTGTEGRGEHDNGVSTTMLKTEGPVDSRYTPVHFDWLGIDYSPSCTPILRRPSDGAIYKHMMVGLFPADPSSQTFSSIRVGMR